MDPLSKKVFVKTYGCQMNVYDSERMRDVLAPLGYAETDRPGDGDGEQGGDQRAGDCGQGAVDRRDRVPFCRPDEADAECLERLAAAEEHDEEDRGQHDDDNAAGGEEADVEAGIGEVRLARADQRFGRCYRFHRHAPEHPERTSVIQS